MCSAFYELRLPGNSGSWRTPWSMPCCCLKTTSSKSGDLPSALARRVSVSTENLATMEERERKAIMEALEASRGNKKKAAQKLGISRSALYNKLKKYGLDS